MATKDHNMRKKVVIPEELKRKLPAMIEEMDRIANDPAVREAGEKLHRELSRLTAEELLRQFTI